MADGGDLDGLVRREVIGRGRLPGERQPPRRPEAEEVDRHRVAVRPDQPGSGHHRADEEGGIGDHQQPGERRRVEAAAGIAGFHGKGGGQRISPGPCHEVAATLAGQGKQALNSKENFASAAMLNRGFPSPAQAPITTRLFGRPP